MDQVIGVLVDPETVTIEDWHQIALSAQANAEEIPQLVSNDYCSWQGCLLENMWDRGRICGE